MPRNWASFPPFTLLVVALRVVDTLVCALVDTGASFSLIDLRLVTQLGLTAAGTRSVIGLGTTPLQVSLVTLNNVMIGRCPLHPSPPGSSTSHISGWGFSSCWALMPFEDIASSSTWRKAVCIYSTNQWPGASVTP